MQTSKPYLVARSRDLETLIEKTKDYIHNAKAPATLRAYKSDFEDFKRFCREHGFCSLPAAPETVALYIADCASRLCSGTINRRLTSITKAHQAAGCKDSPASTHHFVVSETLKGIRRAIGTAQHGKKPLLTADIQRIIAHCPNRLSGTRDRALILIGFAGAFRRSELASLDVSDISYSTQGIVINLRRSKTDQEGHGRKVGIPFGRNAATCPVRALRLWRKESGIRSGPLFRAIDRHGHIAQRRMNSASVNWILKQGARRARMKVEPLGGHSLRAGCVTQAAINGAHERDIMRQTGHVSTSMLAKYIRIGLIFTCNAAACLGI
jgi:integrase